VQNPNLAWVATFEEDEEGREEVTTKYGFIDKCGKLVIPFQYDSAFSFKDGLAAVTIGGIESLINREGRSVWTAQVDWSDPLEVLDRMGAQVDTDGKNRITEINFTGTRITDSVLQKIDLVNSKGLTHVTDLSLANVVRGKGITDAGLKFLAKLPSLECLDVCQTHITGRGLTHISRPDKLRELDLSYSQLTDASIVHLEKFSNLRDLDLTGTGITDGAIRVLKGLKRLERLCVIETKITENGAKKLEAALPNTEILHW